MTEKALEERLNRKWKQITEKPIIVGEVNLNTLQGKTEAEKMKHLTTILEKMAQNHKKDLESHGSNTERTTTARIGDGDVGSSCQPQATRSTAHAADTAKTSSAKDQTKK